MVILLAFWLSLCLCRQLPGLAAGAASAARLASPVARDCRGRPTADGSARRGCSEAAAGLGSDQGPAALPSRRLVRPSVPPEEVRIYPFIEHGSRGQHMDPLVSHMLWNSSGHTIFLRSAPAPRLMLRPLTDRRAAPSGAFCTTHSAPPLNNASWSDPPVCTKGPFRSSTRSASGFQRSGNPTAPPA